MDVLSSDVSTLELFCAFCACREATKLQREATALETSLEEKRLRRHNLLLECKVQDLKIKLLFGSLDDISEVEVLKVFTKHRYHGGALTREFKDPFYCLTGLFLLHSNVQIHSIHVIVSLSFKRRIYFYFCRQKYCLQVFLLVLETYSWEIHKILWYKKMGMKIRGYTGSVQKCK